MLSGVIPSAIAIAVSLVVLIILVMKGMNLIPAALLCSLFLSFFVEGGVPTGLFTTFTGGFGSIAASYVVPFLCAGIFSGLMSASGSDMSFGRAIVSKFGKNSAIYGLGLFVAILAACGVTSFPVLASVLAFTLLKAADLPRPVGVLVLATCGSAFMFVMPGAPSVLNVIMSQLIPGTNLFAGSWIGFLMVALQVAWGFVYIKMVVIPGYRRKGEGYTDTPTEVALRGQFADIPEESLPAFWKSGLPMFCVIALVIVLQLGFNLDSYLCCCIALLVGSVIIIALNRGLLSGKVFSALSNGCMNSCVPMIMICVVAGYGALVTSTTAYAAILGWVTSLQINPYILVAVGTALLAGICGDAASGMVISAQSICQTAISMGANAAMVKRLAMTACTTLDSLPHSSNIAAYLSFMGCTHKEAYRQVAVIQILGTSVVTAVGCVLMMIFY